MTPVTGGKKDSIIYRCPDDKHQLHKEQGEMLKQLETTAAKLKMSYIPEIIITGGWQEKDN